MKPIAYLLTATALALTPIATFAQDAGAEPNYETVDLAAGFENDPYVVALQSGGETDASALGDTCVGFIANAPDVRLNYAAGEYPLYISATSAEDTTLVVNGPDGQWYCDDDGAGNFNPLVWFDAPQSGQYDIWVGTLEDSTMHDAALNISEVSSESDVDYGEIYTDEAVSEIDFEGEPTYETVSLAAGFTPDPYTVALSSGGGYDAAQLGEPCAGFIAGVPDVRLNYEAGSLPLYIRTRADADTTLAVNGPDGQWYCDDDGGGEVNAQVWFEAPQSGQYDIFVGTFGENSVNPATLEISEIMLAE